MLTAFYSSSQISLQPSPDGLYCTDTAGVREIARVLKELEFSRSELTIYDEILKASEREATAYQALVHKGDSLNNLLQEENNRYQSENRSLKKERWYFAGGGFGLAVIMIFLL